MSSLKGKYAMTKHMSKDQIIDPATMKRRNNNYLRKKRNKNPEGAPKHEDDDGGLSAQANKVLEISKDSISQAPHADQTGTSDTPSTALPTPNMPFKTQRLVLTTVQDLLEKSCFDFAQQWLLDVLKGKNIKEAEQVDLTEWSKIMGKEAKTIPKHATQRIAGTSLTQELTATHQLRDAAVYRKQVDLVRMLELLGAARNLVTIMKDDTRTTTIDKLIEMIEQNASQLKDYQASIQGQLSVDLAIIETKRKTLDRQTEERIEETIHKDEDNCTAFGTTLESYICDFKYGAAANRKPTVKKPERQHDIDLATPTSRTRLGTRSSLTFMSPISTSPGNHGSSFEQAARGADDTEDPAPFSFGANVPPPSAFAPVGVNGSPLTFGQFTTNASPKSSSTAVPISLAERPKSNLVSSKSGDVSGSPPSDAPNSDTSKRQALSSSPSSSLPAISSALQGTRWWLSSANPTSFTTAKPTSSASSASVPGVASRGTS